MLEVVTVEPKAPPKLSVIWLHGLGADAHDFEPAVPYLNIPQRCPVRFVFPNAPEKSVTINMDMRMRAWYDIISPTIGTGPEDQRGIEESCKHVIELIQHELKNGMSSEQIVLAGFSQGGAIALYTGIRHPDPLAGILALSTYLPVANLTKTERHEANREIPILYLHGTLDPVIPFGIAEWSRKQLANLNYNVESKNYQVPHSVSAEELQDIGVWITKRCDAANRNSSY